MNPPLLRNPRSPFRRWLRRIWITVGLTATAVFVTWSLIAFRASGEARMAEISDANVRVERIDGVRRFTPSGRSTKEVGLLFFPGGMVDPTAYAPLAQAVATRGYAAVIVELPRRGAFGGANDPDLLELARDVMRGGGANPRSWVIGGHSRGAVVASQLAHERPAGMAGLVLIGTTHPRDVDLSGLNVPVTKLIGTRDGLARLSAVEANRHLLPASTRCVRIDGGNHSQFGWYGFQPGDRLARISASEQQRQMIGAVIAGLDRAAVELAATSDGK
jgi:predicted alpha/beta-hydrolase family hydrolase